jgi:hypothetical protein
MKDPNATLTSQALVDRRHPWEKPNNADIFLRRMRRYPMSWLVVKYLLKDS